MTNEAGQYEVSPHHLIWAQGTSRQLIGSPPEGGETTPRVITLYPQSPLTITVENGLGEPVSHASVAPLVDGHPPYSPPAEQPPRTNLQGQCVFEWLPPGTYDFVVMPDRMSQEFYTGFRATVAEGEDVELQVIIPPYAPDSDWHQLTALESDWWRQRHEGDFAEFWKSLKKKQQRTIAAAALERLSGPFYLHVQSLLFDAQVAATANEESAVVHLMRHYRDFPATMRHSRDGDLAKAIGALAGAEVIPFFAEAVKDETLTRQARLHAVLALNRIGTPESLAAWRALRDEARLLPGAPQTQTTYTHEERMVESLILLLGLIEGKISLEKERQAHARIDEDYATGTFHWTGGTYHVQRFADEWVPVDLEAMYW